MYTMLLIIHHIRKNVYKYLKKITLLLENAIKLQIPCKALTLIKVYSIINIMKNMKGMIDYDNTGKSNELFY